MLWKYSGQRAMPRATERSRAANDGWPEQERSNGIAGARDLQFWSWMATAPKRSSRTSCAGRKEGDVWRGRGRDIISSRGGLLFLLRAAAGRMINTLLAQRHLESLNAAGSARPSTPPVQPSSATCDTHRQYREPAAPFLPVPRVQASALTARLKDRRLTCSRPCCYRCENFWLVEQFKSRVFLPLSVRAVPPPVTYAFVLDSVSTVPQNVQLGQVSVSEPLPAARTAPTCYARHTSMTCMYCKRSGIMS